MTREKEINPISWVMSQTGEHKKQYILSVLLAILGVAASFVPYIIVAQIIHAMMGGEKKVSFYAIRCVIMAAFWLLRVLFHSFSTATSHKATFTVLGEIRKRATEKLTRMPLGDVISESSGALKNTLIERIDSIETTLAHIIPEFTANILLPAAILIYIFIIDWRMGLASLATFPIGMLCFIGMAMVGNAPYERTVRATKALNNTAVEYINGIQVIKVFGKTKSSYERFVSDANEFGASFIDWMRSSIIPFTFSMVIMPATMISVLPAGGLLVKDGSLASVDFVTIIILSVGMIAPIITCMSYSDDFRTMGTIFGEVQHILDAQEMARPEESVDIADNTLKLENVTFAYQEKEVLHGINIEIPEGSFAALVGPSGSGKSTIARLIAALWDVKEGSITLGGIDIKKIPTDEYADRIAYVSQNNYLFNMSVRENIRLGKPDATDVDVEEAAKKSGCHAFIMGLENGYDTMVGSPGGHLSGGERQRISIARAMLKNAPIVILDEATAYTDPENESIIQKSVSKLTEGKTLIVIAHRLSTITSADRIFVIKDGTVCESGMHGELLGQKGLYSKMYAAHMAAKDTDGGAGND